MANKNPKDLANEFLIKNSGKNYSFIKRYSEWLLILAEEYAFIPNLPDSLEK